MAPEIESAVRFELGLWRDHKYNDGDIIIAWMKKLQKFHVFQYWKPNEDGYGHLVHAPIPSPLGGSLTIIVHDFVPFNEHTEWMLRADTTDEPDPTNLEKILDFIRGLFL